MTSSGETFSASSPSFPPLRPSENAVNATEPPTNRWPGLLLGSLVVILAFLLASFPVRNSDVWLHLARGRLLAQGTFATKIDPDLAFDQWGNQTWLYDLCCYWGYTVLGNAGLVLGKALLAAGVAFLLLRASRSTPGWCVPAVCTGLALLTMSLYLLLHPATVSFLFLVLLLLYLRAAAVKRRPTPLVPWPLVLLFVVWANVDRWFLIGLGVVALTWLGEILEAAFIAEASSKRWPGMLMRRGIAYFVLAAICLLNPSYFRAFMLAKELVRFGSMTGQTMSPFESAYFVKMGWSPASLAYFFLLGLSLLSFLAALSLWRWQRFLPWLGLALLSASQVRAVPFFAIVTGPILAWNIQDILVRRAHWESQKAAQALRLGRALTVMLLCVLALCAWPGWLQGPPFGPRRWAFDLPLSLERGALVVRRWHEEGKLTPTSGGLHLSAETIYTFAWFCPTEKRLYLTLQDSAAEWRQRMRSEGIDHVLVYDTDRHRLSLAWSGLAADPEQWPLLYLEGDLAIFGWRDPEQGGSADRFRDWQLDLDRLAFHPPQAKKAPAEAPDPRASAPSWWHAFWQSAPASSMDRREALMHLLHAEAIQREAPLKHWICWENSQVAALLGVAGMWTFPTALCEARLRLTLFRPQIPEDGSQMSRLAPLDRMVVDLQRHYTLQRDDAPPALYYLAVRAARRAVAANPEDASAYFLLGASYLGLLHATRERTWSIQLPQLLKLRQAQASAALNRALALRPDFLQAHLYLGQLYKEIDYLDLALHHLQTYCHLVGKAGAASEIDNAESLSRQACDAEEVERLAREVQKRENAVTLRTANSPPRERAFWAFRNGLAGKALEILLASDRAAFGIEGVGLELELLLGVGRAWDVREWLSPSEEKDLGALPYHWFLVRAFAASGDYIRAEEECTESARAIVPKPDSPESMSLRENMTLMIGKILLDGQVSPEASFAHLLATVNRMMLTEQIQELAQQMRRQADFTVLRGLLALEEGETDEAAFAFRTALALWKDETTAVTRGGLDFRGRTLAQQCLRWLK